MFLGHPDPLLRCTVQIRIQILYHQTKIVRKTLILAVLWLRYVFLSLKNYVNIAFKSNKQKNLLKSTFYMNVFLGRAAMIGTCFLNFANGTGTLQAFWHFETDLDPWVRYTGLRIRIWLRIALFASGLQDAVRIKFFPSKFILLISFCWYIHTSSKFFLFYLLVIGRIRILIK